MTDEVPGIRVEREVTIHARPGTIFRYFSDPERFSAWFGEGSRIAARPGGAVEVSYPDGRKAAGEVLEVEEDRRIVFTWGYPGEESPMPVGSSRVEVTLAEVPGGTRVSLVHRVPSDEMRSAHVAGWRYYLSVLADAAARDEHAGGLAGRLDRYFAAWSEDDAARREAHLAAAVTEDCRFRDAHGLLHDRAELSAHIGQARRLMPDAALARAGSPVQNGDAVLCGWEATGGMTGKNLFRLAPDGRIREVLGFPAASDAGETAPAAVAGDPEADARPDLEPHWWVRDVERARSLFTEALGFRTIATFPEDGPVTWCMLGRGGARVMFAAPPKREIDADDPQAYVNAVPERIGTGGPVSVYVRVEDVDAVHRKVAARDDAKVIEAVWNPFWGGRQFTLEDAEGNWVTIFGPKA